MDDDFASQLNLDRAIAALGVDGLTFEFGLTPHPVAAAAEKAGAGGAETRSASPIYGYFEREVRKDHIALRNQRTEVARKSAVQRHGAEGAQLLDARLWHGRVFDLFIAELKPGEKLTEVHWWKLVTTLPDSHLPRVEGGTSAGWLLRPTTPSLSALFKTTRPRHHAEAAEAERTNPRAPRYGRNLDLPNGIRPGR